MDTNFEILKGQTLVSVKVDDKEGEDNIIFQTKEGNEYKMHHCQDCCEGVSIEDINGDWQDIIGEEILLAEERTEDAESTWGEAMWTFYILRTVNGSVDIRWHGESNGYYSIGVSFVSKDEDGNFPMW